MPGYHRLIDEEGQYIMRLKAALPVALLAGALLLAGCGSDSPSDTSAAGPTASASAAPSEPAPVATIDAEVAEKLNAVDGQIIIPGSIESNTQELGAACTAAVKPLRDIMAKYESGFAVPVAEKGAMVNELNKARTTCEKDSAQDWADFYANEFAGWLYEKVN